MATWNTYRGGYQARARPWKSGSSVQSKSPTPSPPLGNLILSIHNADLHEEAKAYRSNAMISDCETIASYNWLNKATPTIVVPGEPPRWTPLNEPQRLNEDSGNYFRDQNAAHYPTHPMEPAVVAALSMSPGLPGEVDIVACGSTLGNLLRFIREQNKQFRLLVEVINDTVFFIRRENSPTELLRDVRGFGHTFPEAYTTWDSTVKGSVSHQRLIRYKFGGLGLLVRFEGDGYFAESTRGRSELERRRDDATPSSIDELVDNLTGNGIATNLPVVPGELTVMTAGETISQDSIFDLKTRSRWWRDKQDTFGDELPRLWVAQVPNFILAYHDKGVFNDIRVIRDVRKEIKKWERDNVSALSRLAYLIHRIIDIAKDRPDGKLELRHDTIGTLEVREQLPDAGSALSTETRALWERALLNEQEKSEGDDKSTSDGSDLIEWDDVSDNDYTACSDACDYCGKCTY